MKTADAGTVWGSAALDDGEFVRRLEACEYPNTIFRHADHVRLAWIYLRRLGPDHAETRIVESIRRFAGSLNHPEKYHDTITRAWLRLVAAAYAATPEIEEFAAFAATHRRLLDRGGLAPYYSAALLATDAARQRWVPPDLQPLPTAGR
jgi:hypothetical protein